MGMCATAVRWDVPSANLDEEAALDMHLHSHLQFLILPQPLVPTPSCPHARRQSHHPITHKPASLLRYITPSPTALFPSSWTGRPRPTCVERGVVLA